MSSIYRSNARLRTRAGCLECRKRRKKCDEQPPQCGGCYRNGLPCTWPTAASQPVDGRRRSHRAPRRDSQKASSDLNLPSFRLDDHVDLYQHFAACIIPRLVRQDCLPEYVEQTHMLRLALSFPPLMAIMIAIAALDLDTPANNRVAMEGYLYALRSLQDRMNHDSNAGNEDGLLATTICLCVFENVRSDATPNIGVHITMAGVLLALRPPNHAQNASQSAVVFERICAESFVYYSTLMMLFDPSLDVLCRTDPTIDLDRYFSDFADGDTVIPGVLTAAQPILHASYKFFLLVADVTRLARIQHPLNETDICMWEHIHADLLRWECDLHNDPSTMLYILAMRILLLKVDPAVSILESTEQMNGLLQHGLQIMRALDLRSYFLVYLLWPLAVFGSVAVDDSDRHFVEEQISILAQTRHGQALRVKKLMEAIWSAHEGGQEDWSTMTLRQLRMLLEGTQYTLSIGRDALMSTKSECTMLMDRYIS